MSRVDAGTAGSRSLDSDSFGQLRSSSSFQYGSMKRTLSAQGLAGMRGRANSYNDLPLVALPGLTSRVSISGTTSASQLDLQHFFRSAASFGSLSAASLPDLDLDLVAVEGGWTAPLLLSAGGALLSALQFGINNGNMNTQAAVMRAALGIPPAVASGCAPRDVRGNDAAWGFCVSSFCLSALIGVGPPMNHRL